jgi:hypothetical protein
VLLFASTCPESSGVEGTKKKKDFSPRFGTIRAGKNARVVKLVAKVMLSI